MVASLIALSNLIDFRYGKRKLHIPPCVKIATPYGGRLVGDSSQ